MNPDPPAPSISRAPGLALGLILLAALFGRVPSAAGLDTNAFHVGFTHSLFTEVNENDAKAAVKAWVQTVAKQRDILTDPDPRIFQTTAELLQALQNKQVDGVGISTLEYAAVVRKVPLAPIFVTYHNGQDREQYVVLVRRDSHLDHLADLRGRTLAFHLNARACMAEPWLDTELVKAGAKPTSEWLGKITQSPQLAHVVLPVFFHQCDACVATRSEFETLCELNPQLGQQLKIIAQSPAMVTAMFCFRADYAPAFEAEIFAGLEDLNKTPAGQQVLTIFESEKTQVEPVSCLDSALEILALQAQLAGRAAATNAANARLQVGAPPTAKGATP